MGSASNEVITSKNQEKSRLQEEKCVHCSGKRETQNKRNIKRAVQGKTSVYSKSNTTKPQRHPLRSNPIQPSSSSSPSSPIPNPIPVLTPPRPLPQEEKHHPPHHPINKRTSSQRREENQYELRIIPSPDLRVLDTDASNHEGSGFPAHISKLVFYK